MPGSVALASHELQPPINPGLRPWDASAHTHSEPGPFHSCDAPAMNADAVLGQQRQRKVRKKSILFCMLIHVDPKSANIFLYFSDGWLNHQPGIHVSTFHDSAIAASLAQ